MTKHAFELGCDRTWRRAHWRTTRCIPAEAPCLGILCDGRAFKPYSTVPTTERGSRDATRLAMLEPIIQELRWMIPDLGLGVLVAGCRAEECLPSIACQTLPFFVAEQAMDPSEALDWICGIDVWLIASQLPIASTLAELADHLRIPCVQSSQTADLSHWFEVSRAMLPMQAFRSPRTSRDSSSPFAPLGSVLTVDAALDSLELALSHSMRINVSTAQPIPQSSLRPAA
jgi:hypothetical protein